jgi:hypothetical protein
MTDEQHLEESGAEPEAPEQPSAEAPEASGGPEAEAPEAQEENFVSLTIRLNPATGGVAVNGPIHDRVLCKGMMAEASRAIDEFHVRQAFEAAQKNQPRIVPPDGFRVPKGLLKKVKG